MSLSNKDDIQVSVCVVTYNQENYIAECLESLVTQQTSFKFEIIVGEDCSTDTTRAIVQNYVEKYPEIIVPLFYENKMPYFIVSCRMLLCKGGGAVKLKIPIIL